MASNVAFAAGWLLFAVSILRARVLPKWPAVFLLIFSVVSFFPSFVDPKNVVRAPTRLDEPVPVLFAVAWMGVLLMWKRAPRTGGSSGEDAARVK